jgi:Holliday junction resolvase RusA-like endonuclease
MAAPPQQDVRELVAGMIRFTVRGLPAPQGSKRHVGRGIMVESSKAVGPWRQAVRAEAQRAVETPIGGPVSVTLLFWLTRPGGHYGTGRNAWQVRASAPKVPAGRPDLDKLIRSTLDGLTEGGAWKDDGQVAVITAGKAYASPDQPPACEITLEEL